MPVLESKPKPVTQASTPTIGLARPCLWMPNPGGEPRAAIVTAPGRIVSLTIFDPELDFPVARQAVRHASDPEFARLTDHSAGVWDFAPEV